MGRDMAERRKTWLLVSMLSFFFSMHSVCVGTDIVQERNGSGCEEYRV